MCEPTTIMAVASVVGTTFSVMSQQRQARFQKGTAEYNARVAENEAEETRRVGTEEENIQRRKTAELLSKQKAQLGAAGVELESGSPLQLQEDTITLGEADALRIRSNIEGRIGALGTQSELLQAQGGFAQQAGQSNSFSTLLGGTAQVLDTGVADKWFTPDSAANQITTQTGFQGGSQGVLSGDEFTRGFD